LLALGGFGGCAADPAGVSILDTHDASAEGGAQTDAGGDPSTTTDATSPVSDAGTDATGATIDAGTDAASDAGANCATNNGGCSANATCQTNGTGVTCTCNSGYSGDGVTCADVDECATNNGGCSANAACTNTVGGRTCACNPGYSGDGITCGDADECGTNNGGCSADATCSNAPGGRTCVCNPGYSGDGVTCADIDECATNNGGCSADATCANTVGGRTCTCNGGYSGDGVTCTDIDECATNNGGCDSMAACTNTPGSRTCACKADTYGTGEGAASCTARSCAVIKTHVPDAGDGQYTIDPDLSNAAISPVTVFCDMTSDNGVGYTIAKYTDASLGTGAAVQDSYRTLCAAHGMEIIVPRTKAHALAISAYNGGPPNIVNVYPKVNGASGLSNWTGKCQGADCSFYLSDNNAMCNGEPNGDNNTTTAIYRYNEAVSDPSSCPLGNWNDTPNSQVDIGGYVLCSTNDAGPVMSARNSCNEWKSTNTIWNVGPEGVSGAYPVNFDARGTTSVACDMTYQGGGWTLAFLKNSQHGAPGPVPYNTVGASNFNLNTLATHPRASSASATADLAFFDLNNSPYTEFFLMGAWTGSANLYRSETIAKSSLRIQFGQNGYLLYDTASVSAPGTTYSWCMGDYQYTDDGIGQVNQPAGAPADCKNHGSLGSGWDFGTNSANQGLTMCGNDHGSTWMYGNYGAGQVVYGNTGAAQAIWIR
jgi:hypothetical protein